MFEKVRAIVENFLCVNSGEKLIFYVVLEVRLGWFSGGESLRLSPEVEALA